MYIRNEHTEVVVRASTIEEINALEESSRVQSHVLQLFRDALPVVEKMNGPTDDPRRVLVCRDLVDALNDNPWVDNYAVICDASNNPSDTRHQTIVGVNVTFSLNDTYYFSFSTHALAGC